MLDLEFDRSAGYYRAPPHLKANNGILIVDDLGRQLVSPRELMNRWIVPLDRHRDYLTFHSGYKFMVPFDVVLIFSTNLKPADLADPAFMRRLGHKIHVGALTEDEYKAIFRQVCDELEIAYVETVFEHLLHNHHQRKQRPLLACYPKDLLGQVRDFARYEGVEPQLTVQAIDRAWDNYFIASRQEENAMPLSNPARDIKTKRSSTRLPPPYKGICTMRNTRAIIMMVAAVIAGLGAVIIGAAGFRSGRPVPPISWSSPYPTSTSAAASRPQC